MAVVILILLFVVLPITELYIFVQVADAIGFLWALTLAVATTLVGAWLVKHAGVRVWTRFNEQVRAKRVPAKEVVDGFLLLIAGALFLFPGFLTDCIAVLFLFPPTRALIRTIVLRVTHVQPIVATYESRQDARSVPPPVIDVIDVDPTERDDG